MVKEIERTNLDQPRAVINCIIEDISQLIFIDKGECEVLEVDQTCESGPDKMEEAVASVSDLKEGLESWEDFDTDEVHC